MTRGNDERYLPGSEEEWRVWGRVIGARLVGLLNQQGWTAAQLAAAGGLGHGATSASPAGTPARRPVLDLDRLAGVLSVCPEALLAAAGSSPLDTAASGSRSAAWAGPAGGASLREWLELIGRRVRETRRWRGMAPSLLARRSRLSTQLLTAIEDATTSTATITQLLRIAGVLGVSVVELTACPGASALDVPLAPPVESAPASGGGGRVRREDLRAAREQAYVTVVGRRVRVARRLQELTREQLAAASCQTPQFLAAVERGDPRLEIGRLFHIADGLRVPLTDLFPNSGQHEPASIESDVSQSSTTCADDGGRAAEPARARWPGRVGRR